MREEKRRKTSKRARVRRHLNRSGQLSRRVLWCRREKQDTAEQTWHKYPEENEKNKQWMEESGGGEWENVDQCTCFMSATTSGTVVKWLNASTRSLRCFRWRISSGRSRRWFAWRCSAFRLQNEKNWRAKQTRERSFLLWFCEKVDFFRLQNEKNWRAKQTRERSLP